MNLYNKEGATAQPSPTPSPKSSVRKARDTDAQTASAQRRSASDKGRLSVPDLEVMGYRSRVGVRADLWVGVDGGYSQSAGGQESAVAGGTTEAAAVRSSGARGAVASEDSAAGSRTGQVVQRCQH